MGPRKPRQRVIQPFVPYLRERMMALSGPNRPTAMAGAARARPPGWLYRAHPSAAAATPGAIGALRGSLRDAVDAQARVDFAQFHVVFTEEPTVTRIVWLFGIILRRRRSWTKRRSSKFVVRMARRCVTENRRWAMEASKSSINNKWCRRRRRSG
jgi:hypothetical protein